MRELYVKSLSGEEWPLSLYTVTRNCGTDNASRTIKVTVYQEEQNIQGYNQIQNKAYLVYDGEMYVIENENEVTVGKRVKKNISADHIFYQNMKLRSRIYETITGTFTPKELLDFTLKGTGYTLVLDTTDLPTKIEVENFGNNNPLALLQDAVPNKLKGEFDYTNTEVIVAKQIGRITDKQLRYGFNVNSPSKEIDTTNLRTHIRGTGKVKEETDIVSGVSLPYASRTGKYEIEPGQNKLATWEVGATFKFSFTGTGFSFDTLAHFLGGEWEFSIDGTETKIISTYKDVVAASQTYEVIRSLEDKTHSVVATFKGEDSNNPNTKGTNVNPHNYLLDGNIIKVYRKLVGDEIYTVVTEYTSPLASVYGLLIADPEPDERFTDEASLKNHLKETLTDTIEISIKLTGVQLAEMDLSDVRKGDYLWCILDPFDIDVRIRVVDIEDYEDENKSPVFTLGTIKKKASTIMATLQKTAKNVDVIYDPTTKKVKSKAIDGSTIEVNLSKAKGQLNESQLSFSIPTYELASAVKDGLISSQDYIKLTNLHVGEDGNVDIPLASALNVGLMSAELFQKLNVIQVDQDGRVIVDLTNIEQLIQQQDETIHSQQEQITQLNERLTALENTSSS
ncbi:phage tail protein [Priestia megaterium]|uniref:phage tail protein n=1 Tax=Priestia megaterium TaxID=1404 RepID=UPI00211BC5E7|nr:phage tail protein [Priestia megaterium]